MKVAADVTAGERLPIADIPPDTPEDVSTFIYFFTELIILLIQNKSETKRPAFKSRPFWY